VAVARWKHGDGRSALGPPAGAEVTVVYRRSRAEMPAIAEEVQEAEKKRGLSLLGDAVEVLAKDAACAA